MRIAFQIGQLAATLDSLGKPHAPIRVLAQRASLMRDGFRARERGGILYCGILYCGDHPIEHGNYVIGSKGAA